MGLKAEHAGHQADGDNKNGYKIGSAHYLLSLPGDVLDQLAAKISERQRHEGARLALHRSTLWY